MLPEDARKAALRLIRRTLTGTPLEAEDVRAARSLQFLLQVLDEAVLNELGRLLEYEKKSAEARGE